MKRIAQMLRYTILLLALVWPVVGAAQFNIPGVSGPAATAEPPADGTTAEQEPAADPAEIVADAPPIAETDAVQSLGIDYDQWESLATRAEAIAEAGVASQFALDRLRAEIVIWRDKFLRMQNYNGGRLATVNAQITALGAASETETEAEAITNRRAELQLLRDRLAAPARLAQEASARANGLIGEIDSLIRARQKRELTERGVSPLNPANWRVGFTALSEGMMLVGRETMARFRTGWNRGDIAENITASAFFMVLALALIAWGQRWTHKIQNRITQRDRRGQGVWLFVVSLGQIILPTLGLMALFVGLTNAGLFGFHGLDIIIVIPLAGFIVVLSNWLAEHYFGLGNQRGPLELDADSRKRGRHISAALSWTVAANLIAEVLIGLNKPDNDTSGLVVFFPFVILVCLLLYRLGMIIGRDPKSEDGKVLRAGRMRRAVMALCKIVAIAAPILSVLGYHAATDAILVPAILTLAVIGIVVLLQRLTQDTYSYLSKSPDASNEAMMPLLIGFILILFVLPVLALIWGARVADLIELWTRFREGFSVGETRISPSIFMTFAVIFVVGYALTRFIQGVLRSSFLPRTRLDKGGQNAIVAGFGYVGIFLAALIAVTTAGIDLSNLAIVAGALSVGIGFGLQNIVSNFVAGIILLIERPVSEGEWIEVGGQMGYVRDISVRSTRIETFDRTDVIIPNADLVSGQVTNWTRGNLVGRVIVPVGVSYDSNPERVAEILREIAENHPMVLMSSPPNVIFIGFGADSLDFEIRAILRDINFVMNTKSEMNHEIMKRFKAEGIEIPFTQRDIWLRNPEMLWQGKPQGDESA